MAKKTGDFGAKITKKEIFFLNESLFDLPRSEKRNKELYIFEKGVFWSGPGPKTRVFRNGQVRKMGGFHAAHTRTAPPPRYNPRSQRQESNVV